MADTYTDMAGADPQPFYKPQPGETIFVCQVVRLHAVANAVMESAGEYWHLYIGPTPLGKVPFTPEAPLPSIEVNHTPITILPP